MGYKKKNARISFRIKDHHQPSSSLSAHNFPFVHTLYRYGIISKRRSMVPSIPYLQATKGNATPLSCQRELTPYTHTHTHTRKVHAMEVKKPLCAWKWEIRRCSTGIQGKGGIMALFILTSSFAVSFYSTNVSTREIKVT